MDVFGLGRGIRQWKSFSGLRCRQRIRQGVHHLGSGGNEQHQRPIGHAGDEIYLADSIKELDFEQYLHDNHLISFPFCHTSVLARYKLGIDRNEEIPISSESLALGFQSFGR